MTSRLRRFVTAMAVAIALAAGENHGNSVVATVDSGNVPHGRPNAPAPRPVAAVQEAMATAVAVERTPLRVLLVAGRKDHGKGEHDYPAWRAALARLLAADPMVTVTGSDDLPASDAFAACDVAVFFRMGAWSEALDPAIAAFQERGGGLVILHSAVAALSVGDATVQSITRRLGLTWSPGRPAHEAGKKCCAAHAGDLTLACADLDHPLLTGLRGAQFDLRDETYANLHGDLKRITVLASAKGLPMVWTRDEGGGRVVVDLLGHYNWTHNDPVQRLILLRAIAWAARRPIDRFNDLVLRDADVPKPGP